MENKKVIISTSWDDGHALDYKLAELLDKYNFNGTFYVPIRNSEQPVMNKSELRKIASRYEIGGHTVNHIYLNTLGLADARYEIFECKAILQDLLGKPVEAFCYPGGKYSIRDINLVAEAGFLFGRTTRLLHTSFDIHPSLLDTSIQVYNHSSGVLTAHCLKNRFFVPIIRNLFFYKGNKDFKKMVEILMNNILATGGVFHLWGHSWEIEQYALWDELETVFRMLAFNPEISYLNNTECWEFLKKDESSDLN